MIRDITIYPNAILRQTATAVDIDALKNGRYDKLTRDMIETMKERDGLGIAGPQVGESLRIVIIGAPPGPLALFNPVITHYSWRKKNGEEGCLSVPHVFGFVRRSAHVDVAAYNRQGEKIVFIAEGMLARVVQHEVDHLNGVLFIDLAKKIGSKKMRAN